MEVVMVLRVALCSTSDTNRLQSRPREGSLTGINRVVQKLQFLNNNRLKTAKDADFVKNMRFLEDL
jgi:hypothetical protein